MRCRGAFLAALALLFILGGRSHADTWSDCANTQAYETAIAACSSLIESPPQQGLSGRNLAVAYFNRGAAHNRGEDLASAIVDYGLAINADPTFAHAYNGRGVVFALRGQYVRAIQDYQRALAIDPDFTDALNNRADAYRNLAQLDKALADLDRVIALDPTFAEAYYTRGEVKLDQNKFDAARADLEEGMRHDKIGVNLDYARSLLQELDRRLAVVPGPAGTPAEEHRIALVIGNGAYQKTGRLANPPNDADIIADALRQTGFDEVEIALDLDRDGMVRALQDFAPRADEADWAVVYFAGHGLEMGGVNYLIPVDAQLSTDRDVEDEAITLTRVLSAVEGAGKLRLVVLDACRNNPFLGSMTSTSAARVVSRGLARVEPSKATIVAYAAKEGTLAADGDDGNSPYAAALAQRLTETGIEVNKVFRFVRNDVLNATAGRQEPFVYGSLPPEDFYFIPPG